jgi:hypothetical protein
VILAYLNQAYHAFFKKYHTRQCHTTWHNINLVFQKNLLSPSFTMKTEAVHSSKMLAHLYQTTCYILCSSQSQPNLKSHVAFYLIFSNLLWYITRQNDWQYSHLKDVLQAVFGNWQCAFPTLYTTFSEYAFRCVCRPNVDTLCGMSSPFQGLLVKHCLNSTSLMVVIQWA